MMGVNSLPKTITRLHRGGDLNPGPSAPESSALTTQLRAIFMTRQMQENFRIKGKKLYFGFVDLEKAFDRVPRDVISWAMRKLGVEEWLISAVMSIYTADYKV